VGQEGILRGGRRPPLTLTMREIHSARDKLAQTRHGDAPFCQYQKFYIQVGLAESRGVTAITKVATPVLLERPKAWNMNDSRVLILLLALAVPSGYAASHKVAPDLANVPSDSTVSVIVRYKLQPNDRLHRLVAQQGGHLRHSLELVRSEAYTLPATSLQDLSDDPDVEYIAPDRPVKATLDFAQPAINANLALKYGYDGNGITVAVIDSGIMDTHPDLLDAAGKSRVVYAESFNLSEGNDYFDRYGHGTHVAGILGGDASMSSGSSYTRTFMGIAPKVKFVNLKVLDRNGAGTDSMVIAAIQRAIALKSTYHIRVINLSLGRPVMESYQQDPLCQAVEQAWKAGIVVVVAAGNEGRNNTKDPRKNYFTFKEVIV